MSGGSNPIAGHELAHTAPDFSALQDQQQKDWSNEMSVIGMGMDAKKAVDSAFDGLNQANAQNQQAQNQSLQDFLKRIPKNTYGGFTALS